MTRWLAGLPVEIAAPPGWLEVGAPAEGPPLVCVEAEEGAPPRPEGRELLAGDGVAVRERGGRLEAAVFDRSAPARGPRAWVRLDPAERRALLVAPSPENEADRTLREESCLELVVAHLWPLFGAAYLHAASTRAEPGARLFLGSSGAGKSTAARLLVGAGDVPLGEDRCAVGEGWAAGAPFHGGARDGGARAPLGALFALDREGPEGVERLSPARALLFLSACAFLTRWWAPGLEAGLGRLEAIARTSPLFRLSARPDGRLVELVRRAAG